METANSRNCGAELSDILGSQKGNFLGRGRLCADQAKAYNDILDCRTAKMGSHTLTCDTCGKSRVSYNSCRNRHCPKCQYVRQLLWVEKLQCRLLPVRYFHVVFTIPEFLKPLFYLNQVVSYLGRYTHRVAISNSRIQSVEDGTVKFRWKDYRDRKTKIMELPCAEFTRRFMQHVLPSGFYKIRYYGIMSSANSKTKMEDCFRLLKAARFISFYEGLSTYEILEEILGQDPFRCPGCETGKMIYGLAEGKGTDP